MSNATNIARTAANALPAPVRSALKHATDPAMVSPYAKFSFSQEGEDMLLERIFEGQQSGFYVDVGAHHPTRFSNTHLLYRRGWCGINIDATPGSMVPFEKSRPRDINLEVAITSEPGTVQLTVFNEPALNTVSDARADEIGDRDRYSVTETVDVPAYTLAGVLGTHLPENTAIDLMTIDVEGLDFEVIQSNDWSQYRPRVLLIEVLGTSLDDLVTLPEISFLKDNGYQTESKLFNTVVLMDHQA